MPERLRPPRVGFAPIDPDAFQKVALGQIRARLQSEGTDPEQLSLLRSGTTKWNEWRGANPKTAVHLGGADLSGIDLTGMMLSNASLIAANCQKTNFTDANLSGADLSGCVLNDAHLFRTNLTGGRLVAAECQKAYFGRAALGGTTWIGSNVTGSKFHGSKLVEANFHLSHLDGADCTDANFFKANFTDAHLISMIGTRASFRSSDLTGADCSNAELSGADFRGAILVGTRLDHATLTGSLVHGCSVWRVSLDGANQDNLVVTDDDESRVTVDSLEVAQFIYLLLSNERIRQVIDTITSKVVLILGRFTPERKAILDAIRNELRKRNFLPVLFDFEKPSSRDITETVSTLAHMARFVIADITDAKSIPQELSSIVRDLPSVPVQPLLLASQHEYGMFEHFRRYPWVLEPYLYEDQDRLLAALSEKVIGPAEAKVKEQTGR